MQIEPTQILFQIINFGVVVGVLTFLLYKPVLKVLEERSQRIEEGQKAAEAAMAEKNNLEEMKAKIKKEAEKEAAKIIDDARASAKEQAKQILAQAEAKSQEELAQAREQLENEKSQLARDMKKEFNDAVITVSEKVLEGLDKKAQTALIKANLDTIMKKIA